MALDFLSYKMSTDRRGEISLKQKGGMRNRQNEEDPRLFHPEERAGEHHFCEQIIKCLSFMVALLFFPFSICFCLRVVQEYERAIILRLGHLKDRKPIGPGLIFFLPCIDELHIVDMRTLSFNIESQEILTSDSVTVTVEAVVYYRVECPVQAICNVANYDKSTRLLALTTLRTVLGMVDLGELLSARDEIGFEVLKSFEKPAQAWGVDVERVEIKDVHLPIHMQRSMAAEAEAKREAKAKVIASEGEKKASASLAEAAEIMYTSSGALQLRYLQTLNTISADSKATVIFPVPVDFLQMFSGAGAGGHTRHEHK